jgi:proteasome lid subunit RPN8/RPN11
MVEALVVHARAEYPNEACGIIGGSAPHSAGGHANRWFPARNAYASPLRFTIDSQDLLRIYTTIDDADEAVWAIVHSHVRSPARPSPTDVGRASDWPGALWILISLADAEPDIRAWRITDGEVHEVVLEVTE